jgi:hypothetical protein
LREMALRKDEDEIEDIMENEYKDEEQSIE